MQLAHNFCGIYCPPDTPTVPPYCLPLEHLHAEVTVVDISAIVTLTQQFWQYLPTLLTHSKYVFPVPAGAAVCGFQMRTQDGRVIKAISKEKEQARMEHNIATLQGKMTGLVEQVTDDVFSISLGALPASQIVTITVTYVVDLMDADLSDQVRFQLPVCVGTRYGTPPEGMASPFNASSRVEVNATIRMKGAIRSIVSSSHTIRTDAPASAEFRSDTFLQKAFWLVVTADGLNAPRCFAERHPSGTIAMQLSMVPKFDATPIPEQEYVFLIDRSGSMQGTRIETAKSALAMLLRSLPSKGTTFNIFSFGNRCDSTFPESVQYTQETLAKATTYVDFMSANYGGTEIRRALHQVFSTRSTSVPTACFVLTDGEAHDIDRTLRTVAEATTSAPHDAPLRVFTLGIGDTVSTAMCEGISRAGNGICLMAATSESILAKAAKLVRASRTHFPADATIDWGTDFTAPSDVTSQSDTFRQAPLRVPPLYSGSRFVTFALLRHQGFIIPQHVTVRAREQGSGKEVVISVPVTELPQPLDNSQPHLVHTLAARKIIQDLDDSDRNAPGPSAAVKPTIVHLGEQYQLASRYTSFIAVDESGNVSVAEDTGLSQTPSYHQQMMNTHGFIPIPSAAGAAPPSQPAMALWAATAARPSPAHARQAAHMQQMQQMQQSQQMLQTLQMPQMWQMAQMQQQQQASFSALDSLSPQSHSSPLSARKSTSIKILPRADPSTPNAKRRKREDNHPVAATLKSNPLCLNLSSIAPPAPVPSATGVDAAVLDLVRLQSVDGSFAPTPALEAIVGAGALAEGQKLGIDRTVWATVLAVVYLRKYLVGQQELLEGLIEKAKEFLSQPGVDFQELVDVAALLVA